MESIEQRAAYKILWPDHVRGPDQKCATNASKAKAGQGRGEDEENREAWPEIEVVYCSATTMTFIT